MKGIIVGLGGRGRSWINVCQKNPEVKLVGYVEPVPELRARVAEQFNLPKEQLFSSLSDALKAEGKEEREEKEEKSLSLRYAQGRL